jgi:hypothetical protein
MYAAMLRRLRRAPLSGFWPVREVVPRGDDAPPAKLAGEG